MRRSVALGALLLALGCGEEADDTSTDESAVEAVAPEEANVPAVAEVSDETSYTIHEWGLIDFDLGEARVEYAAGPGQAAAAPSGGNNGGGSNTGGNNNAGGSSSGGSDTRPNVVTDAVDTANNVLDVLTGAPARPTRPHRRKPVLYFHLSDENPEFTFDLSVNLGDDARVLEHYPAGTLEGHQVSWSGVGLTSASCSGGPYPTAESDACEGVADDYCEAAELAAYEADDAGCLTVGGSQQNFLFYRGDGPSPALPLTIVRNADGTVTVTNASLGEPVGELLRIRRSGAAIQVAQITIPAAGASISVGLPATDTSDAHRDVIRAQLTSIGLTPGEAGAFERAWFGELFDPSASTPHAFPDAVLFFLPAAQVDGYAHLEATPAPAATVRAMAIRAGWTTL